MRSISKSHAASLRAIVRATIKKSSKSTSMWDCDSQLRGKSQALLDNIIDILNQEFSQFGISAEPFMLAGLATIDEHFEECDPKDIELSWYEYLLMPVTVPLGYSIDAFAITEKWNGFHAELSSEFIKIINEMEKNHEKSA